MSKRVGVIAAGNRIGAVSGTSVFLRFGPWIISSSTSVKPAVVPVWTYTMTAREQAFRTAAWQLLSHGVQDVGYPDGITSHPQCTALGAVQLFHELYQDKV